MFVLVAACNAVPHDESQHNGSLHDTIYFKTWEHTFLHFKGDSQNYMYLYMGRHDSSRKLFRLEPLSDDW